MAGARDDSHRSLLDERAVERGMRGVARQVQDKVVLDDVRGRVGRLRAKPDGCNLVLPGVRSLDDLEPLRDLEGAIPRDGAIWAIHPKGRKDRREVDVIEAGKAAGLVDTKVVRFSDTHTALRFVVPRARR